MLVRLTLVPLLFICYCSLGQATYKSIDSLASAIGMEFVYGERVPMLNPLGYYGSTAVFNFLVTKKWSGLFLFRKLYNPKVARDKDDLDLFNDYDYFLVFYWRDDNGVLKHNILPVSSTLNGMFLHYGSTNLSLSTFRYLDGNRERGPRINADYSNGCVPILISGMASTRVLYYYNGRWLERKEIFD
jgi:hypothetical protein